jgi:lipopolysaccharide assembly protein A
MQIVRTVIWVLLLVALAIFTYANWIPVSVRIWDNLLLDTMLPAIVVVSFAIGFVPTWLYHRAVVPARPVEAETETASPPEPSAPFPHPGAPLP